MINESENTVRTEPSSSQSDSPREKRARATGATSRKGKEKGKAIDLTAEDDAQVQSPPSKKKKKGASPREVKDEEKRLRRFRQYAPSSYLEKLNRATTQRMFVIDRTRGGTDEIPEETIDMAGTTGNIYNITISQLPSCTCPDNQKSNQCKHIVYVLHNVLKVPEHLQYQLAFLSSELREIFAAAPTPASSETSANADAPSNRKEVSGNCPICFTEFEPETEEIAWCKAACGNNLHKICFEQWAKSQSGKELRCIYCRTPWQGDEDSIKRIKNFGQVNGEGYVNVAGELGLSGARDYSTYHQYWVRRQGFGYY
ncbi:hypothetical protein ABVK25_004396 [Lepraria finkii]|uniref:Uncharacterized protein n=1 Tax=Lepraria finkii TaxID=1340010 RepID=A0ABR4BCL1_9LECA